jgi:hypothetical protein
MALSGRDNPSGECPLSHHLHIVAKRILSDCQYLIFNRVALVVGRHSHILCRSPKHGRRWFVAAKLRFTDGGTHEATLFSSALKEQYGAIFDKGRCRCA